MGTAAQAGTVVISVDTFIGCDDGSIDGMDVVVDGAMLTIDCDHTLASLTLVNNGVVTHTSGGIIPPGETEPVGMHLTVTGDISIEGGSLIRANRRGFASASGPGGGGSDDYAGGGAHAGAGGDSSSLASYPDGRGGSSYGSVHEPVSLGSGGGRDTNNAVGGGRGGGAIRLTVGGTCLIDGSVEALGGDSNGSQAGAGAGGSIWIACGTLAGSGQIVADGGIGTSQSGGGGGGRIALEYEMSTFIGPVSAFGGMGSVDGGAGTVLLDNRTGGGTAMLVIDNNASTDRALTEINGEVVVTADVLVTNGAHIGHATGLQGAHLTVNGSLEIGEGGSVDIRLRGHGAGEGPGTGSQGTNYAGGAGHGGAGG
ncbi:MAG: hypothetical protein KDA21_10290, partial [Phycisphaerales bacterium]|nr:hypothetical protein [Phycisphaerales bacterium]